MSRLHTLVYWMNTIINGPADNTGHNSKSGKKLPMFIVHTICHRDFMTILLGFWLWGINAAANHFHDCPTTRGLHSLDPIGLTLQPEIMWITCNFVQPTIWHVTSAGWPTVTSHNLCQSNKRHFGKILWDVPLKDTGWLSIRIRNIYICCRRVLMAKVYKPLLWTSTTHTWTKSRNPVPMWHEHMVESRSKDLWSFPLPKAWRIGCALSGMVETPDPRCTV